MRYEICMLQVWLGYPKETTQSVLGMEHEQKKWYAMSVKNVAMSQKKTNIVEANVRATIEYPGTRAQIVLRNANLV